MNGTECHLEVAFNWDVIGWTFAKILTFIFVELILRKNRTVTKKSYGAVKVATYFYPHLIVMLWKCKCITQLHSVERSSQRNIATLKLGLSFAILRIYAWQSSLLKSFSRNRLNMMFRVKIWYGNHHKSNQTCDQPHQSQLRLQWIVSPWYRKYTFRT